MKLLYNDWFVRMVNILINMKKLVIMGWAYLARDALSLWIKLTLLDILQLFKLEIMKRKFKQWWSTIPSIISTKRTVYSYWLGPRTTAVLFDPRTELLGEAEGWGQQFSQRVKQNSCCSRNQSITDLLYILYLIIFNALYFNFFSCF